MYHLNLKPRSKLRSSCLVAAADRHSGGLVGAVTISLMEGRRVEANSTNEHLLEWATLSFVHERHLHSGKEDQAMYCYKPVDLEAV